MANAIERIYEKYVTNHVAVGILALPAGLIFYQFRNDIESATAFSIYLTIAQACLWWLSGKKEAVGAAVTISVCLLLTIFGII